MENNIACIILTLNEEPRITECLEQLKSYVGYILVLDGGSKDKTVAIAKKYVNHIEIKGTHPSDFAADKNYAWSLIPKDFKWVLFTDADERWNETFLKDIKNIVSNHDILGFRFPRENLPTLKDYPDYQVRLLKNDGSLEWRRELHEVVYHKEKNKPIDQINIISLEYPIIHLPRREDIGRSWW